MKRLWSYLIFLAAVACGCGSASADRSEVLQALAEDTIIPTLEELASNAASLETAVSELCADPSDATLSASRGALANARTSWSASEAMWVGPVIQRRSWGLVDWPIDASRIEELLADATIELDAEHLSTRIAASQRGLGAVEYFLWGSQDETSISAFADARRCDYLIGVTEVIADETALLPGDWASDFEDGGPWTDSFIDPETASLDAMINDASFLLEAMSDAELGTALGEMGEPSSDGIVEGPAGLGAADLAGHVTGLRSVLIGESPARGLSPLLGDETTTRLTEAFVTADAAIASIDGPLGATVAEQPERVGAARDAIKVIQTLVATEVVSTLGVTIGFSDADGDTGS